MPSELTGSAGVAAPARALPEGARAFQAMLQPHLPRLHRTCLALERNRDDAAELLQDAMVQAWRYRSAYDGSGSVFGWLYRIVQHQHLDRLRRNARRRRLWSGLTHTLLELWDSVLPSQGPDEFSEQIDSAEELLEALRAVAEPFRLVVQLCDVEELDYAAVAEVLGVPIGTVKSRHARGRAKLREALLARRRQLPGAANAASPREEP